MKFFNNLPKTNFESSIGTFTISDFFTYLDVEHVLVSEGSISIDDKTTLLEAASLNYGDVNSFWAFVPANYTINPFDLLAPNTFLFSQTNADKINLILLPSPNAVTGGVAFPVGSILTPYNNNSGASYQYGSTGNFDLSGALAVIEQSSFYDGNMVIGSQVGGTGSFISINNPSEHVVVIQKNTDGSYTWAGDYYTGNKKAYTQKVTTQVLNDDGKTIYKETVSSNPTLDTYIPSSTPINGITTPNLFTVINNVVNKTKLIEAYIPSELGLIQSSFITTKYN
jgi:hypothetical protein